MISKMLVSLVTQKIVSGILTDELPDQYIIVTQGATLGISGLFHAIVLLAVLSYEAHKQKIIRRL